QNDSFAVCGHDRAVRLARHFAGFKNELAPAPLDLLAVVVEHFLIPCFPQPDCSGPFLLVVRLNTQARPKQQRAANEGPPRLRASEQNESMGSAAQAQSLD